METNEELDKERENRREEQREEGTTDNNRGEKIQEGDGYYIYTVKDLKETRGVNNMITKEGAQKEKEGSSEMGLKEIDEPKQGWKSMLDYIERKEERDKEERKEEREKERKERREKEQEEREERERREERMLKRNMPDNETAKLSDRIRSRLTIDDLKKENYEGLQSLNKWIKDIEYNVKDDKTKVRMFERTADEQLVEILGMDKEGATDNTTWNELKVKLREQIPKVNPSQIINSILSEKMSINDNILSFTSKVRRKYNEARMALNNKEMEHDLNYVLAKTVVGNMNETGKDTYEPRIMKNAQETIKEMEEEFRTNKDYMKSLFKKDNEDRNTGGNTVKKGENRQGNGEKTVMFYEGEEDRILTTEISREGRERERIQNQYIRNRHLEERREERPDGPFQQPTGSSRVAAGRTEDPSTRRNDGYTPQQGNSQNNLTYGERRKEMLRSWNDWRCEICDKTNRASWYTCDRRRCTGKQTGRQRPRNAWTCNERCGQNNYVWDWWCTKCLQQKPGTPEETRRPVPTHWKPIPREQQIWYSRPPIINP